MSERLEEQVEQFSRALERLREALAEPESDIVRDAIIQRFEFTFEMAWRVMFRYLSDHGERVQRMAWAVIPAAVEALLLDDAELWDQMREQRNLTSHTYDEAKAIQVAAFIRSRALAGFDSLAKKLAAHED